MYRGTTSFVVTRSVRGSVLSRFRFVIAARACFRFSHSYRIRADMEGGLLETRNTLVADCFCCCDIIIRVAI